MSARASWKGSLRIGDLRCQVGLYAAVSSSERVSLHLVNRKTGHRLQRRYVDDETGKPVEQADQVKGYEVADEEYVSFEPEEIAAVIPESDKTLQIDAFLKCDDIDPVYFDRPYYLAPANKASEECFALIREGLNTGKVAAIARTVIFRRLRTFLIRPHDASLIAIALNYDYEIRSASEAFDDIPKLRIKGEMLDLAKHIIATKKGTFSPAAFEDRYEDALSELIKAKVDGKPLPKRPERKVENVVDLMDALRKSASGKARQADRAVPSKKGAAPRKKSAAPARKKARPAVRRKAS